MRLLRHRQNLLVLCCSIFITVILLACQFTNIFDLVYYFLSWKPQPLPLSLHCNAGRLGNQMCTYATLYGLSALNRRPFKVLSCNIKHLRKYFVGPSKAKSIHENWYYKWHSWSLHPYFKLQDAAIPVNSNFLEGYLYPCSYTFFDHVRDKLRHEFRFKDYLIQHAQNVLRSANVNNLENVTYVSVHVRRGDYNKQWLAVFEGVPVNMEYFQKAFQYFREKYKNVIFIAISDDRLWCIKNLSGTFGAYIPKEPPSPAHDLAVLASCNHSILSYGTFGFWGAYLAGGDVLYFDKFLKPNTSFTLENFIFEKMYPARWKGIATFNDSYWLEYEKKTNKSEEKESSKSEEKNIMLEKNGTEVNS